MRDNMYKCIFSMHGLDVVNGHNQALLLAFVVSYAKLKTHDLACFQFDVRTVDLVSNNVRQQNNPFQEVYQISEFHCKYHHYHQ